MPFGKQTPEWDYWDRGLIKGARKRAGETSGKQAKETYAVQASCNNCGHAKQVEIPKGVPIINRRGACSNCGCNTVGFSPPERY